MQETLIEKGNIVDEVFSYANLAAENATKFLRCLISDLNPSAVEKPLKKITTQP